MRPADDLFVSFFFSPRQVLALLPPSLIVFKAGDVHLKACKYVKLWCEPGSNTTQCLRGPTKAQWYTDRHGTFSTLTQTSALLLRLYFPLVIMAVGQKPWREGLYLFIGPRLRCVMYHPYPSTSLKYQTKIHLILQSKPQALHGHPPSIHARHDKACPCDNSAVSDGRRHSHWSKPLRRMIGSQGHQRRT